MRSEQEKFLLLLKGPEDYAHRAGEEMLSVLNSGKRPRYSAMSKVADQHFETIMQTFNIEQNINIVKTWVSSYHLPFDPDRLKSFDQFHQLYGSFITDNPKLIRSY
jgi:hypothetical protein